MKLFSIFTALFLLAGVSFVAAQDLIIMRNGNMIEARVMEISPTEIRYKHFDNLDGPTIVIPVANILSIRYENGNSQIFNAITDVGQSSTPADNSGTTIIDPDKFIFGFNVNPSGLLLFGPSVCFELGKGNFNSEIIIFLPHSGIFDVNIGGLITFNYFWHGRLGGAYLGGGIGIIDYTYRSYGTVWSVISFTIGLNAGYKFVTNSGVYFRTGAYIGYESFYGVYFKPDLTLGWTVR